MPHYPVSPLPSELLEHSIILSISLRKILLECMGKNAEIKLKWEGEKFFRNGKSITIFNNISNSFYTTKRKIAQRQIDVQYYSVLMSIFTYNFLKFMSKTNCK